MKSSMSETNTGLAWQDGLGADLERECEMWDWARTAGVSLQELRSALLESLAPEPEREDAEAA
jgi:hypothetical protein